MVDSNSTVLENHIINLIWIYFFCRNLFVDFLYAVVWLHWEISDFSVSLISILLADVQFLPISGLMGTNMKKRLDKSICPWWDGPCLFEALDATDIPERDPKGPFRCDSVFMFLSSNLQSELTYYFHPILLVVWVETSSLVNKFDFWFIFLIFFNVSPTKFTIKTCMVCVGLENALFCWLLSCLCWYVYH